ncbi:MAG: hypothetical protein AAF401_19215 [Pseudomonadota bacterium]
MRIKRITVTLPPRLRHVAEREARLIAQQAAEQLGDNAPSHISVEMPSHGGAGHGLATQIGGRIGATAKGGR